MRCAECVTRPESSSHYCEGCGRELSAGTPDAAKSDVQNAELARIEAARKTAASVVADRAAAAAKREREDLAKEPRPVPVLPVVPPPRSAHRSVWMMGAAAVVVGGFCVSQRELLIGILRPVQATPAVHAAQPAPLDLSLARLPEITSIVPREADTPPPAERSTHPAVKAAAKPAPAARQIAAVDVPAPEAQAVAPAAPSPESNARMQSVEAAAPVGRFFEPNNVDVPPTVATRIEPQLPPDLKGQPINDIVILRVLVSQNGDPSRVSLLRKSKHGQSLDDAVVAAVTQWRFSPARKRGEAVSSWYNVGVPLGRAN